MCIQELILEKHLKRIAIIGMAKNVGKTTTLNALQAGLSHLRLGFLSLGRDGEPQDLVTFREKPAIWVPRGSLVATAARMEEAATAKLQPLVTTSIRTPFGPVVLFRVLQEGEVILTGSRTGEQVQALLDFMEEECQIILIDGALNRRRTATPLLSDATILATGAAVSSSLSTVIQRTKDAVTILETPPLQDERLICILEEYKGEQGFLFLYGTGHREFYPGPSFLGSESFFRPRIHPDLEVLYLSGALTSSNLQAITRSFTDHFPLQLVLPDATHLFVTPGELGPFYHQGGQLQVLDRIHLLAVTVNPTSPIGPSFPASYFFKQLAQGLKGVPLFDVQTGFSTVKEKNPMGGMKR